MIGMTASSFVENLKQHRLLSSDQLDEVSTTLLKQCPDARALARELVQRGWLTPFAVNRLLANRADELVLGAYVLLDRLGEGGMGAVYKARHQKMNRVVALKVIRKERLGDPEAVQRFEREVEAAARLAHPNVVAAYDAAQVGDVHFFAMEYVDGTDLGKFVKAHGPLPVHTACNYIAQAARGLQHAFERGLTHRDIKPANLALTADRTTVKLLDMGLARLSTMNAASTPLTQSGAVVGTPDYLAPEQARNPRNADIRADLYALGCTLYFLLTGRSPFGGDTLTEALLKHQFEEAVPLETIRPDVDLPVREVVRRLMAKRPEDRYQTPAELAEVLESLAVPSAAMSAAGISVAPLAAPVRFDSSSPTAVISIVAPVMRKPPGWFPWLAAGAVGAIVVFGLLVGAVVVFWRWSAAPLVVKPPSVETARRDPERARSHWKRGKEHLEAGQYDPAIAEFTQAIDHDPTLSEAVFDRATAHFKKGNFDKALADQEQVALLRPKDALPHFNRGAIYHAKGDLERAIAEYGKAIQITPGYSAALINRGTCYMDTQRFDLAIRDFDTVLRLDPMNAAAFLNRGTVHYRRKEDDEALADLDRAVQFNGNSADAYYNRSLVHRRKGNQAEAEADLRKARELNPDVIKR